MDMIKLLQEWYSKNCDGDWEHIFGINIGTLDNPGWQVDIDLTDTSLEDKKFESIKTYVDESNWMFCEVSDNVFKGRGSKDKLQEILKVFFDWEASNSIISE